MIRTAAPCLLFALAACGGSEPARYTLTVEIDAPEWVDSESVNFIDVPPCPNAELFDTTLRVYDDYDPADITAVRVIYTGVNLSGASSNEYTYLLAEGETKRIYAALQPSLWLYTIDHKGQLLEEDPDVAKVRGRSSAEVAYNLGAGDGIDVTEVHTLAKEVEPLDFIEPGNWNCDEMFTAY